MITDEQTNTVYISDLLKEKYPEVHTALSSTLRQERVPLLEIKNTRDIWVRDFMPVQLGTDRFVLFIYNPSYLKTKRDRHLRTE